MSSTRALVRAMPLAVAIAAAIFGSSLALAQAQPQKAPGLREPASVSYDAEGVPTIVARNDFDLAYLLGYVHARDRFFQMDYLRRVASGTVAELVGEAGLSNDVQLRTLGLRRAAFESWVAASDELRGLLKAYADGVNFYLANNPLPPEYTALELTRADPWQPLDSLVIGKVLAFQLSFDLDIDFTIRLGAYQQAGSAAGFNGTALFFEDTHRVMPPDNRVSIPGFLAGIGGRGADDAKSAGAAAAVDWVGADTLAMALAYRAQIQNNPLLAPTLERHQERGSNWWIIGGRHTQSGRPILANDPHLALEIPPTWNEVNLFSSDPRFPAPLDVVGTAVPGTPLAILGCTTSFCWGLTTNPMDVTDVYQETLRFNNFGVPVATVTGGVERPLVVLSQSYFVNNPSDRILNNVTRTNTIGLTNGGLTFIVPGRNNGPIVQTQGNQGFSVAYTGWGPTQELEAFRRVNRARGLDEFRAALSFFDVGSQNFAYAGRDGTIAYFVTAEAPIRADLQQLGAPDGGIPPFLIRDGSGQRRHEWLPVTNRQPNQATPFEVLPLAEMPFVINPASGYIANANNDPIGVTLDNNPLNQIRPGGGLYYLGVGYSAYRQGRIDREIQRLIASGRRITVEDMQALQANNQPLDAELLRPFLLSAFQNARQANAWAELRALGNDARIVAAIERLQAWDFSTPTGIREGFDPGDDPANLPEPSATEIRNSTAATVWAAFRGQLVRGTIDATLTGVGLGNFLPGNEESYRSVKFLLDNFASTRGRGASGLNFFNVPNAPSPEAARDFVLLRSLRQGLELLSSEAFRPAFNGSTNIDDYRWGRLHRVTFRHPIGSVAPLFNIPGPNPYPFRDLSPQLPGVARPGGYEVVDASGHSVRANTVNGFTFGGGPVRRFVGEMTDEIRAFQIIPGGQSGVLGDPLYVSQLGRWLTNRYKPLAVGRDAALARERVRLKFVP